VILLGTSGWQYPHWRERFYPAKTPQRLWLEYYAERFATVEVNNAFYRLPERGTFGSWRDRTPADFRFAVKMSRYLTHIKRLRDPAEPVERFMSRAEALGDKLGPVLLQLPPSLPVDLTSLDETLSRFPPGIKVAVEPRHRSWWAPETQRLLERHNAALCWADRLGRPVTPLWRTADFGYLRLHEGRAQPRPRYGPDALRTWLDRIARSYPTGPVYVYSNNDPGGAGLADTTALAAQTRRRDLPVSRTPEFS
jgi:uncharacterized protein YecE (DUF72 family)